METTNTETAATELKVFAAGVLAGAYRGQDISARNTLTHAVANGEIKLGRISRAYGEAFCDRKLDAYQSLVDECMWESADKVTCPKCLAILARMGTR